MATESRGNIQSQYGSGQSGSGQSGQSSQTGSFSHATSAVNTAGSVAHGAVDKAATAADHVLEKVTKGVHDVVDKAVGATTPAARWIEEREIYAKEKEEALVKATSDWVLAHPVKSLGIAFVAGLLVGRITS